MKIFYSKHTEDVPYFNIPYLIPIQSGTANSDKRFNIKYHDNDGLDNISDRNELFTDLSVQYFIYKNLDFDDEECIGLFQEKRMLLDNFICNTIIDNNAIKFMDGPHNPTKFVRCKINKNNANEMLEKLILKDNYDFSYYDFITRHTTFYLPLIPVKDYIIFHNGEKNCEMHDRCS